MVRPGYPNKGNTHSNQSGHQSSGEQHETPPTKIIELGNETAELVGRESYPGDETTPREGQPTTMTTLRNVISRFWWITIPSMIGAGGLFHRVCDMFGLCPFGRH
jgi:hypothetical protein